MGADNAQYLLKLLHNKDSQQKVHNKTSQHNDMTGYNKM